MRGSITGYAKNISGLHELSERVKGYGNIYNRTRKEIKIYIIGDWWTEILSESFETLKPNLIHESKLNHPNPVLRRCLFTDTSGSHLAALLKHIPSIQKSGPFEDQEHAPLNFLFVHFIGN